jgi:hypothetical protein
MIELKTDGLNGCRRMVAPGRGRRRAHACIFSGMLMIIPSNSGFSSPRWLPPPGSQEIIPPDLLCCLALPVDAATAQNPCQTKAL